MVCRAAFAHNSKNVIGAPLVSYLIQNGSRFYFLHTFQYCPLRDLWKLLKSEDVTSVVKFGQEGDVYSENQALHYLCQPDVLKNLCAKDFYEKYETVYISTRVNKRKRGEPCLRYKAYTGHFQHCSAT